MSADTSPKRPTRGRVILRFAGALALTGLFLLVLVEAAARLAWNLSSADKRPPDPPPPDPVVGLHKIAEWPASRGRIFHEAPMLQARVKAGTLPPVAERLPLEPQVIIPPQQVGPYGGTWHRFGTEPTDIQTYVVHRLPYPNLLRWSPMADKLQPHIMTHWEVSDGGRTFTFHLRKGIRWSDGVPFTAEDILFWYTYVLQNKDLTPSIPREYKHGGELMTVEKLDDYTVRFHFKEPNGRFVQQMAAMPGWEIIDVAAHYFKKFHPDFVPVEKLNAMAKEKGFDFWYQYFANLRDWTNPDAPRLWPWVVTKPPPARPIVLERNPYFWKVDPQGNQLPYIDRITFDIYDAETINLKAINGEVDMQNRHIRFENYPLFIEHARKGHYRVLKWIDTNGGTNNLALNLNHPDPVLRKIFGDKRFRIALSLAIDRKAINEACFFGVGEPRQCAPPPGSRFYSEKYAHAYINYDPSEANRLLDEMGLKRGKDGTRLRPDGKPISVAIDCIAMTSSLGALEMVAHDWTTVGVKARVNVLARQLFYQRKAALMHDVGVWYGADEQVPFLDPRWFFPWNNESIQGVAYAAWFRSGGKKGEEPPAEIKQCMDLYKQLERTTDEEEQRRLFMQIIELNRQNLWVIGTIGQVPSLFIVKDTFRNVPTVALNGWQFRGPANTAPECYAIEEEGG